MPDCCIGVQPGREHSQTVRQPEVAEYEVLHDTPEVVGTEGREVLRGSSGSAVMRVRVTAYEANRLMAFHLQGNGMRIHTAYALTPDGDGTRLTVRTDLRLPGTGVRRRQ